MGDHEFMVGAKMIDMGDTVVNYINGHCSDQKSTLGTKGKYLDGFFFSNHLTTCLQWLVVPH